MGSVTPPAEAGEFETRLFINGNFVEAKSTNRLSIYSANDNSLVSSDVHVAGQADVDDAVAAARAAFSSWASTPPIQRCKLLLRLADLIEANAEELGRLEALCSGKPMSQTRQFEVPLAANVFRYYAGWCDKLEGESWPADNGFMKVVRREPLGVCAAVNAFNGPLVMIAFKGAPCLAAGNTMVMKSSEKTPLSTIFFGKLLQQAQIPPGVFNLLSGAGETGALLASHMDVDKISFTGSVNTGKKIAVAAASSNLKRVTLELGGKSPSIVFPDANLDVATQWCVQGIVGNSGQACIASSRVYVHKDIRETFVQRLKTAFEQSHAAFGKDAHSDSTHIGPLVDKSQFEKVTQYVEAGKAEATLITGGQALYDQGCWMTPTIFLDPVPDAKIYREEIFGPVVVVSDFSTEEDVIHRANATTFGLSGAVFTQDVNRAMRVASQITSGTVCVNCCTMVDYTVPFGGLKQSGWGRELGKVCRHIPMFDPQRTWRFFVAG
ncbi:Aldehyde dehydrogenase [Fonsecaea pedrosoi]|nr:Aldehyde dehydrogenase [Fonsecaea pedrosoi]